MSPPKSRKSLCPWVTCEKCQATLAQKDTAAHEQCCSTESINHGFIKNKILYTTVEIYKSSEFPKNISTREANNIVFMSESAMQLCEIAIGDPVSIVNKDNLIVKTAWPMNDKNLTTVCLTKNAIELDKLEGSIRLENLKSNPVIALEVVIEPVGKSCTEELTTELNVLIKNYNHNRIFSIGNRINIPYYGRKLIYKIINVKTNDELLDRFSTLNISENQDSDKLIFLTRYSTKWIVQCNTEKEKSEKQNRHRLECIGGYTDLIEDLKDVFNIGLGKYGNLENLHISRGILLCGPSGVGKTMLSEALLSEFKVHTVKISNSDVYNKNSKETELVLSDKFKEAFENVPSIIYIEDIEILCPKKSSSISENEKRTLATFISLFDSLHNNKNVMVLAVTSKPDAVDISLRRPGRLDKEFEMTVPTRQIRKEIILKFIEKMPHTLSEIDVDEIAYETHGYVGADLHGLCSQAAMTAIKKTLHSEKTSDPSEVKVTRKDFEYALTVVSPSAIKEVVIDVPNVKWSDIGGQHDLKLQLKQSVEWPLKHANSFKTIGIAPPKGVLMYGPPGCSKTMIAKALATESKLNFLNIKGPELFSKWVGDSEKAVRDLFKKARQVAPSIIFIDEIDALGMERGTSSKSGGNSVQERVLTQLLTELDGVAARGNVTIVAATNRPDRIDKALLRPGRFDRLIYVPLPDEMTRLEIFNIQFSKMSISEEVILEDLVDMTEGYSGAEIQAVCNEAGMKALEEDVNATQVTKEHFAKALLIVVPRTNTELIRIYENFTRNRIY